MKINFIGVVIPREKPAFFKRIPMFRNRLNTGHKFWTLCIVGNQFSCDVPGDVEPNRPCVTCVIGMVQHRDDRKSNHCKKKCREYCAPSSEDSPHFRFVRAYCRISSSCESACCMQKHSREDDEQHYEVKIAQTGNIKRIQKALSRNPCAQYGQNFIWNWKSGKQED